MQKLSQEAVGCPRSPGRRWRCSPGKVQEFIQALLENEVTALLGRAKSVRRAAVDAASGYRNGYGKPRRWDYSVDCGRFRSPPASLRSGVEGLKEFGREKIAES